MIKSKDSVQFIITNNNQNSSILECSDKNGTFQSALDQNMGEVSSPLAPLYRDGSIKLENKLSGEMVSAYQEGSPEAKHV